MIRLAHKVAIVTGGSRGIGRAIAERFVDEGARVLSCGRGARPHGLPECISFLTLDISRNGEVQRLRDEAVRTFGAIDVLVNNAGVQIEKPVTETTDDDWDLLMGINAKAVFSCCRAFIPNMAVSGGGSIINIGSISGRVADPSMAIYNASKAFVHGLTRSIAVDHGKQGIRCNAIAPGWIMTDMANAAFELAKNPETARRDALLRHPAGRFGQATDIASLAVWLASDESKFATGQVYTVDGGVTAASPLQPGLF